MAPLTDATLPWRARLRPARPGFTLLELMITLAVVTVLVAVGVPSIGQWLARHRLQSAAQQLGADLATGRHEAARRRTDLHLVARSGRLWCWGLALRPDADCQHSPAQDSALLKVVQSVEHPGITLVEADTLLLRPQQADARVTPGHLRLQNRHGEQLQVQLSPLGRAMLCSPATTGPLARYGPCATAAVALAVPADTAAPAAPADIRPAATADTAATSAAAQPGAQRATPP